MRILVLADVHGEHKKLSALLEEAPKDIDLVICPGDVTDMFNVPQHFSQTDIANLVIQKLLSLGKPLLCVPGNQDPYEILEMFDDYGINLHGKTKKEAGMAFGGWGGARTPFNTIFEPTEEETAEALERLGKELKPPFVLVVHNPPKGTKLDLVSSGEHAGSQAIRDFILKSKPLLVISAHIHENRGTDTLGESTVFYPGPAYEGWYGVVEIKGSKVTCESRKAELEG